MSYTGEDLVKAARDGDLVKVRDCLNHHVDINYRSDGGTALMEAAWRGHENMISILLRNNADPNIKNIRGNTAMMWAGCCGHENTISILLRNNADPNIKNNIGWTAMMEAALKGYENIISILLRNNADPNIKDDDGRDALHIARQYGRQRCVQILEQQINRQPVTRNPLDHVGSGTANPSTPEFPSNQMFPHPSYHEIPGSVPAHQGVSWGPPPSYDEAVETKDFPLHYACKQNQVDKVEELLTSLTDLSITDSDGKTPIQIARENNFADVLYLLMNHQHQYLQYVKDFPLHAACATNDLDKVKNLLKENPDLNIVDGEGKTVTDIARTKGFSEVVYYLMEHKMKQSGLC